MIFYNVYLVLRNSSQRGPFIIVLINCRASGPVVGSKLKRYKEEKRICNKLTIVLFERFVDQFQYNVSVKKITSYEFLPIYFKENKKQKLKIVNYLFGSNPKILALSRNSCRKCFETKKSSTYELNRLYRIVDRFNVNLNCKLAC